MKQEIGVLRRSEIGIVSVLYNSASVLEDFFRTLDQQTYRDFTLYLVDNASPDNSLAEAYRLAQTVSFRTVIIEEPENWGAAKGNNIGILRALEDGCPYVLLSNNDVVLDPDTIQYLYDGLKKRRLDMAVPKIFYHEDPTLIWSCGGRFHPFKGTTEQFGMMLSDSEIFSADSECDYSPTTFMLINADVFNKVGMLDENYFIYYEDTDFVWRAVKEHRLRLGTVAASKMWHKESVCTGGYKSDSGIYYLNRNKRYFVGKNYKFLRKYVTLAYITVYRNLIYPLKWGKEKQSLMRKANKDALKMLREK